MLTFRRHRICSTWVIAGALQLAHASCAASPPPTSIMPRNLVITPFGYGPVTQFLTTSSGASGQSQCQSKNHALLCFSVSGGLSCGQSVPAGQLISCGAPRVRPVDEAAFLPVGCNQQELGDDGVSGQINSDDFCLLANYMPQRSQDTLYQYDDFVRLGVNRRFGGMVMELYGTDRLDRIMQNPGGGVQLSLWAFTTGYANKAIPENFYAVADATQPNWRLSFDATGYVTQADCLNNHPGQACQLGVAGPNLLGSGVQPYPCASNGDAAGAPINPIQGWSTDCNVGQPSGAVDTVTSSLPGTVTVTKSNPANFTRSDVFAGLTWRQTSQVVGPYALLSYTMAGPAGATADTSFQEIPAIFLHDGMGAYAYYYSGAAPYLNAASPVSRMNTSTDTTDVFQFPNRQGPFSVGSNAPLGEDWVSVCDAQETHCVTVASVSSVAQDVILQPHSLKGAYLGVRGFFSLINQMNVKVTVAIFPYRFDDIVMGMSVRQWIYQIHRQLPSGS